MKVPKIIKLPSGSYFCQLRIDGQSISITDEDPDIVFAKAVAIKAGLIQTKKKPEEMTLRQACTKYIDSRRSRLSPTTAETYEIIRDKYFQTIMDLPLTKLTTDKLDAALAAECTRKSRTGRPYSPKTIKNSYMFLVSVLGKYHKDLDTDIPLPEVKRKIPVMIAPETLFPVIIGSSIELPCLLAMWLSLSASEIRGLTKSKSIEGDRLIVRETVVNVKGKAVRKEGGKEVTRTRALQLPPYIKKLIDQVEGDIIVPLSRQTIYNRLDRLLKNNNLPHISFHALRHINASVMAMLNIPEKEANERGGWCTDYTRKQVYTHTFTAQRQIADQAIDHYFSTMLPSSANENANE